MEEGGHAKVSESRKVNNELINGSKCIYILREFLVPSLYIWICEQDKKKKRWEVP